MNDCTSEELAKAMQALGTKNGNGQQEKKGQQVSDVDDKEAGMRRMILSGLNKVYSGNQEAIDEFFLELSTTVEGLEKLDYGQLDTILGVVNDLVERTAEKR